MEIEIDDPDGARAIRVIRAIRGFLFQFSSGTETAPPPSNTTV
jgi:hypothetical protein